MRLDLGNIYHSAAYIGILGLILCSMTAATFTKVIPRRIPRLNPVKIDAIPLHATVRVAGDVESARERLAAFFAERGWQVRKREFGGTEWTFADKNNWARRGVLVAHVGFVLIATGTTIYWAKGYSGQFAVLSGQTATIPENGVKVDLKRFAYRIDPIQTKAGTVYQPIDYVSNATVTGSDGKPQAAEIRVNHPVRGGRHRDLPGDVRFRDRFPAHQGRAARARRGASAQGRRRLRRSPGRRARSSTSDSSARSTARRAGPPPTRAPTIPAL